MNHEPLISVITITYNAAGVIGPTCESVKSQKFGSIEHIIIDGASSDATLELARESGRPDLRIISEPDKGLYDAMNKGLHFAKGKYVVFLNAGDTFADSSTLQLYAEAALTDPDIIYGDTLLVDAGRKIVGPRHLSAPTVLSADSFASGMLICHQAFMVKKDIAPDYNLEYRLSADYDWCIKCIDASRPDARINLNHVTIHYLTDGLTDRNMKASLKERFKIMSRRYGLIPTALRHIGFLSRFLMRKLNK